MFLGKYAAFTHIARDEVVAGTQTCNVREGSGSNVKYVLKVLGASPTSCIQIIQCFGTITYSSNCERATGSRAMWRTLF